MLPKLKVKRKVLRIMKRLFLTVVAVLSMTMTFAENEKLNSVENVSAYDMTVNYVKLADCLQLSGDQVELVQDIHTSFSADMMNVAYANADERDFMIKNAIAKNLKIMRLVLNGQQYRKYLTLLNLTFNNRGLNK